MQDMFRSTRSFLGIQLNSAQIAALECYERELLNWNEKFNLTAIHEPEKIRVKHFLDSLTCLLVMRETPMDRVIDIGTGAGFPGLPLKIVCPAMQLTLVESVGKKAEFCRHIVQKLKLEGVGIVQERAEALGQLPAYRERYDWVLARAVAIMPVLAEYLLPLAKVGGAMLAMKGESAPAEAHSADHAIRILGGHLRKLVPVALPGVADERYLIVVDKVAATPLGYPRRVGLPAKKPIL
jgi:16S rRNA (guanine527-N7)-methyltransferase